MLTAQLKPSKFSKLLFHCFVEHFLIYITLRRRGRCVVHIFIIHLYTAVAFAHAVATIVGSLSWSSWTSFQSMEACFVSPKLTCGNCARNAQSISLPEKLATSPLYPYDCHSHSPLILNFVPVHFRSPHMYSAVNYVYMKPFKLSVYTSIVICFICHSFVNFFVRHSLVHPQPFTCENGY